jgi:hypothetical protein
MGDAYSLYELFFEVEAQLNRPISIEEGRYLLLKSSLPEKTAYTRQEFDHAVNTAQKTDLSRSDQMVEEIGRMIGEAQAENLLVAWGQIVAKEDIYLLKLLNREIVRLLGIMSESGELREIIDHQSKELLQRKFLAPKVEEIEKIYLEVIDKWQKNRQGNLERQRAKKWSDNPLMRRSK